MLADIGDSSNRSGSLGNDVHLPATSLYELLGFIYDELPRWRDRDERKHETSETSLTSQLCAHLSSATRHAGLDFLQFRTEEPDEKTKGRKLDLVVAPRGATVWIEGRRHIDFDTLMPIECKRLPTPKEKGRDEREYVINDYGTTGGIQRFKAGFHGANHRLGAMIAYVQQESRTFWNTKVSEWITDLIATSEPGWTADDHLDRVQDDDALHPTVFRSFHGRDKGLPEIELRHLWISMN